MTRSKLKEVVEKGVVSVLCVCVCVFGGVGVIQLNFHRNVVFR